MHLQSSELPKQGHRKLNLKEQTYPVVAVYADKPASDKIKSSFHPVISVSYDKTVLALGFCAHKAGLLG